MTEERANDLMVLGLLVVDAVLLAMLELSFVTFTVGATPAPVSALLALVSTPWLVGRAAELAKGTLGAAAPLIGWTATICVLGLTGPGGDVLLLGDWPSLLLVVGGLLPGAYVLGKAIRMRNEAGAGSVNSAI